MTARPREAAPSIASAPASAPVVAAPSAPALAPEAAPIGGEAQVGESAIRDAELLLAALRTLLLLALAVAPRVFSIESYGTQAMVLMAVAGVYNIFTITASLAPSRFCLRRPLIIAMDTTLISAWIHLSGRWDLVPFYYVVVVVAAMWYRVLGGVLAAAACDFLFLFLWARLASSDAMRVPPFTVSMALNSILLFVIGALAGYVAEAQDREREQRLERELLIANYQSEIDLSGELQPLLLSRLDPGQAGAGDLDIGAALQSARAVGGGDYLDAIPLPNGTTLLCIADVSGKSIRAQARVPLLKYSLRALAPLHPEPAELMARLQSTLLPDLGPELYIALCLVVLDARQECLSWCNAGHLAPLLVRGAAATPARRPAKTGEVGARAPIELAATAPALGLFPDAKIAQKSLSWKRGDALLMFTDGLTDALSFGGEIDGEAQIKTLALRLGQVANASNASASGASASASNASASNASASGASASGAGKARLLTVSQGQNTSDSGANIGSLEGGANATADAIGGAFSGGENGILSAGEAARELVSLAGVALDDKPFVARHFTLGERVAAPRVHRDDVAVLVALWAPRGQIESLKS